jgi:hypothetical protein
LSRQVEWRQRAISRGRALVVRRAYAHGTPSGSGMEVAPGAWSLEEFANERTGRRVPAHRGGKPLQKRGRGDLWLGLKTRSDLRRQHSFTIEAKQVSEGKNAPTVVKNIEAALGRAKAQLRTVRKDFRFGLPVGVCCYWPAITPIGFHVKMVLHPSSSPETLTRFHRQP